MNRVSAKPKIYLALAIWLIVCFVVFSYVFKFLERANKQTKSKIDQQNKELTVLEAEKESFDKAKEDLSNLSQKDLQPEDFFSKDITLVNEIKTLETLAQNLGVELNLSGISGTTKTAPKAKTQGDIVIIPYSISLNGQFSKTVDYIESLENLPFITRLTALSINAAASGNVNANLTANFYLRK